MEQDLTLEWRPGVQQQLAHAPSRAPRVEPHGEDINDSFPGDNSTARPAQLPKGLILDGVPLSILRGTVEDDNGHVIASLGTVPVISSSAFVAIALTPEVDATPPNAASYAAFDTNTRTTGTTPALPTAELLGCCGRESIRASEGNLEVLGARDHNWRAL